MVNKDYRKNSSDRERKLSWSGLKERVCPLAAVKVQYAVESFIADLPTAGRNNVAARKTLAVLAGRQCVGCRSHGPDAADHSPISRPSSAPARADTRPHTRV